MWGASGLGVFAEAGGGRAAGELLTSWIQYPSVPCLTRSKGFVLGQSVASVHLYIYTSV